MKLIHDYLSNSKQRIKVNDVYSSWKDMFYGDPQEFILGPLFIQYTFMWPILLFGRLRHCKLNIESYADDAAIYMVNEKESQSLVH